MRVSALANSRCPSTEPNGPEHANHNPSVLGIAAVPPLLRAGMPVDHDAGRTGESPVSAKVGQPNRMDWNTPTTTRQSREVLR
ncbi:MAG: hypothetical protein EBU40_09515 [Proteobacteria bacterium]|nr:hypothetical protein [Pseudomonadota bacterium]